MTTTVAVCPFEVGDRVRVNPGKVTKRMRFLRGVVTSVLRGERLTDTWWLTVKREGAKAKFDTYYSPLYPDRNKWEVVPVCDLSMDDTATGLARAVLAGDIEAARALADRVFELAGGR